MQTLESPPSMLNSAKSAKNVVPVSLSTVFLFSLYSECTKAFPASLAKKKKKISASIKYFHISQRGVKSENSKDKKYVKRVFKNIRNFKEIEVFRFQFVMHYTLNLKYSKTVLATPFNKLFIQENLLKYL